jgi:hypothetical protein
VPLGARRPHPQGPIGSGINVWDKLGGGKGSNRDDPTQ